MLNLLCFVHHNENELMSRIELIPAFFYHTKDKKEQLFPPMISRRDNKKEIFLRKSISILRENQIYFIRILFWNLFLLFCHFLISSLVEIDNQ